MYKLHIYYLQSDILLITALVSVRLHFYTCLTYNLVLFLSSDVLTYLPFRGYLYIYMNHLHMCFYLN